MFITKRATPGELLSQLITNGGGVAPAPDAFTAYRHNNDLCPAFKQKIDVLLECYSRHRASAYDIQGFRDQGVDVFFTFVDDEDETHAQGVQIKSYKEIEDDLKRSSGQRSLVSLLKSQYFDAKRVHHVETFYVVLCGDTGKKHREFVRKVCAEFAGMEDAKVIEPANAWAFFKMEDADITGYCARVLCRDDCVVREANRLFVDKTDEFRRTVLWAVVRQLEDDSHLEVSDLEEMAFGPEDDPPSDEAQDRFLEAVQHLLWTGDFESDDGERMKLAPDSFIEVRALYFDTRVRLGLTSEDAFRHLDILTAQEQETEDQDEDSA